MKKSHALCGAMLTLLVACATTGSPEKWIRVGITTRAEVVEQYGEPDMVTVSNDEETAIYRIKASAQVSTHIDITTAQAAPFGTTMMRTESVNPGLGVRPLSAGALDRPSKEFRIRYDARGIVLDVQ